MSKQSSKSCGIFTLHRVRHEKENTSSPALKSRDLDLKSSVSSVTEQRDKKHLASHSDSTIGFLGPDLAAPKMHCSTTIIRRQEARRKPGDQGLWGAYYRCRGCRRDARAHFELISITG